MTETPNPLGTPENPPFTTSGATAPAPDGPAPYNYPPGPYEGGPGQYPGAPVQYPGVPGQYPGVPGQYPGAPGQYPGGPGQYPGGMYPPSPLPYGEYPGTFAAPRNGLGVAALVTGIVALLAAFTVFGGVGLGVVAVILGFLGRVRVKKGQANNGGVATAGIVIGAVAVVASIALFSFGLWMFHKVGGNSYLDCIRDAGQDQAQVQQCSEDFRESVENRFGTTAPSR